MECTYERRIRNSSKIILKACGFATLVSACSLFLASVLVPLADAQIISVISGRVRDQQGLALPGVALRLKNTETGRYRYARSDATGSYRIAGLSWRVLMKLPHRKQDLATSY